MHSCQADACVNMDAYAYGTVDVVACLRLVLSRFWVMRASDDRADVLPPIFTSQAHPAPAGPGVYRRCVTHSCRGASHDLAPSRSSGCCAQHFSARTVTPANVHAAMLLWKIGSEKITITLVFSPITLVFSPIMEDDVKPSPFLVPCLGSCSGCR